MGTLSLIATKVALEAGGATQSTFVSGLVKWAAGIGGGLIAIFLIYSIVKDGLDYAKGNGSNSILKIVGKVLFLILLIGLVYVAMNYDNLGKKAQKVGDQAINVVESGLNDAGLGGGEGGEGDQV